MHGYTCMHQKDHVQVGLRLGIKGTRYGYG